MSDRRPVVAFRDARRPSARRTSAWVGFVILPRSRGVASGTVNEPPAGSR